MLSCIVPADILINNGGATNEEMMKGKGDEAYLAAFKLHVTGAARCALCMQQPALCNDCALSQLMRWGTAVHHFMACCMHMQGTLHSSGQLRRSSSRTRCAV